VTAWAARFGTSKEHKELIHVARRQGWHVEITGGGHLKFVPRDPTKPIVYTSMTPGDRRSWLAARARLRRSGLRV
jgi:hypothetical protein